MSHYNSLANEIRKTCIAADVSNQKATCEEIQDLRDLAFAASEGADVLKHSLHLAYDMEDAGTVPTAEIDRKESLIAASARADQASIEAQMAFEEAADARNKASIAAGEAADAVNR